MARETLLSPDKTAAPRDPLILVGAIRENAERPQVRMNEPSFSVERIIQLTEELEQSLTLQQFRNSVALRAVEKKSCDQS